MREAACEASAKGEADTWPGGRDWPLAQVRLVLALHGIHFASLLFIDQWAARPEKTVPTYFARIEEVGFCPKTKQYLLTSFVPSLYHWRPQCRERFSPTSGRIETLRGAE